MTHTTVDAGDGPAISDAPGRRLSLVLLAVCAAVLGLATVRLAMVTAATPPPLWLVEYAPLLPEPGSVSAETSARAQGMSRFVSDPRLATARLAPCIDARAAAGEAGDLVARQAATRACLGLVEALLATAPLSGELWLQKALFRFELGDFAGFEDSLRLSYRTAPREGWVAARRAPLGVATHAALPDDLKALVMGDLALLLSHQSLAASFVARFVADADFREQALPLIEALPEAEQETFVGFVSAAGGR